MTQCPTCGQPWPFVTQIDFERALIQLEDKLTAMTEATQQDIDNLTVQVKQVSTDLDTAKTTLQAEIDKLANDGVDVTQLQAAVAPLDDAVKALSQLQPTPVTPPASTEPPTVS